MRPWPILGCALALALAACRPDDREVSPVPAPPPSAAAPSPSAVTPPLAAGSPPAPVAPTPPTPAPLLAAPLRSALAREPAATVALTAAAETVVDPASTFEVEIAARLDDARLVLLDAADALVAARDVREAGATTRLTLAPEAPLVPAGRYVLRAEGSARRELRDANGRELAPLAFPLLVAGTPPPPEPKKSARRRRR